MHARTQELMQHLEASNEGLLDALAAIPAAQRDSRPTADVWSAANVVSHLARTEGQVAAFLQRALRKALADSSLPTASTTDPVLATMDQNQVLDRTARRDAPEFALPDAAMTAAVAVQELERARARTREVLVAADGLDTTTVRQPHHVLGELTFEQWIAFVGLHQQRHTAQLRELASKLAR